ncbi:MAG: hypothetical protein IT167_10150 [Bryobacterales bacterium]|nr:hypothetical protein [Bryobacterales bacterium]
MFARTDIFGNQEITVSIDARPDVEQYLIAAEPGGVKDLGCAWIGGEGRRRQAADEVVPDAVTQGAGGGDPAFGGGFDGNGPEGGALFGRLFSLGDSLMMRASQAMI